MKKKYVSTLAGALGIALASAVACSAAPFISDTYNGTGYTKKFMSLEQYRNQDGVDAQLVEFYYHPDASLQTTDQVNIIATPSISYYPTTKNAQAQINMTAGRVFLLAQGSHINNSGCASGAGLTGSSWYVVGEGGTDGAIEPEVHTFINDCYLFNLRNGLPATTNGSIVLDKSVSLAAQHGKVAALTGGGYLEGQAILALGNACNSTGQGLNLRVIKDLNPTCADPTRIVQLSATAPYQNVVLNTEVLQMVKQFEGTANASVWDAELDTDRDFTRFFRAWTAQGWLAGSVEWNGYDLDSSIGADGTFVSLINNQTQGKMACKFRSFIKDDAAAAIEYTMASIPAQPGFDDKYPGASDVDCTTGDHKTWSCSWTGLVGDVTGSSNVTFEMSNDSDYEMSPTPWTLASKTATAPEDQTSGAGAFLWVAGRPTCVNFNQIVGNWWGGLEIIVPYVKAGGSYETYIKLYNRYHSPLDGKNKSAAKIYISNMNQDKNSIVPANRQFSNPALYAIPEGGSWLLTGTAITTEALTDGGAKIATEAELAAGLPIKFLVRVPSQSGNEFNRNRILGDAGDLIGFAPTAALNELLARTTLNNITQKDPYINGTVMITYGPNGTYQKNGQLLFKTFKNGQYGNN
jgi:hypothetical protein